MFRDFTTPLVVQMANQDGAVIYTRAIDLRTLTSPDRLVLVLSEEPALDSLAGVAPGKARVVYITLDELPERWEALDAVDLMAFRNFSFGTLKPDHLHALQQWLARGGHLLITAGPNWVHYTHPALRELIAVKVGGLVEITTLAPLEALAGVPSPGEVRVPILRTEAQSGSILAATEEHALVISQRRGRGEVVFVTFDPGRAPLAGWDGPLPCGERCFDWRKPPIIGNCAGNCARLSKRPGLHRPCNCRCFPFLRICCWRCS